MRERSRWALDRLSALVRKPTKNRLITPQEDWHQAHIHDQYHLMAVSTNFRLTLKFREWCRDNCRGGFAVRAKVVRFENERDLFRFKMQFGEYLK